MLNDREKILFDSAKSLEYKKVDDGPDLSIHFYLPVDIEKSEKRTVILFLNSGGWNRGNVLEFAPHALYFVERGAVCGLVEYRNRTSHSESNPIQSIQDVQAAIRFTRHFADRLTIDPEKLIVIGADAGANMAACATMKAQFPADKVLEFDGMSSRPDAAILLSPIVNPLKGNYGYDAFGESGDSRRASLTRYLSGGIPPMLIIHGTDDRLIPCPRVAEFAAAMERKRNSCKFIQFEGRNHNFYNLNVDPISYEATLVAADDFLVEHSFLGKDMSEDGPRLISWREDDY